MAIKGAQPPLAATDSGLRPGCFPVGSAQSRAAARAMLTTRRAGEEDLRIQSFSVVDGSRVNLDGLAERIRAVRDRLDVGESPASIQRGERGQTSNRGRQADCLEERIKRAQERLERIQGQDSIL